MCIHSRYTAKYHDISQWIQLATCLNTPVAWRAVQCVHTCFTWFLCPSSLPFPSPPPPPLGPGYRTSSSWGEKKIYPIISCILTILVPSDRHHFCHILIISNVNSYIQKLSMEKFLLEFTRGIIGCRSELRVLKYTISRIRTNNNNYLFVKNIQNMLIK